MRTLKKASVMGEQMIQTQGHLIPYMSSDWNPIIKCEICLLVSPSLCSPESKQPVITGGPIKANHLRPPLLAWMGFPGGSVDKKPASNAGDAGDEGLIPGLGRSTGIGQSNPLQYSCLECHGQRSLAGSSPWGHKELGMTEWLSGTIGMDGEWALWVAMKSHIWPVLADADLFIPPNNWDTNTDNTLVHRFILS